MLANRNQCAHTRSVALAPDQNEKGGTQAVDAIGFRTSIAISDGVFMNTEYDMAVSFGELHDGLKKSKRNVMWKDSVAGYVANDLKNTYTLRKSLVSGKYKIDSYQRFRIHEPKEREITATRIKDRQFQRSLCDNVLYPQITRSFIYDNCACQRGKGVDFALNRMKRHIERHYREHGVSGWVLRCDIKQYFASTPHRAAKDAIVKRVTSPAAAARAFEIIDSFDGCVGIGLGSQVSQLVQLAVLDDLDHYIKERLHVKRYIRYMDDFVLIHESREHLELCLREIANMLAALGLSLNSKTQIHPVSQGIVFLKWRFVLTATGKAIMKMNPKSVSKERRKLRKLKLLLDSGKISMRDVRDNYRSWKANAKRGNTRSLVLKMDEYYRELFKEGAP
jgi:RNA-directed DNA polymerase